MKTVLLVIHLMIATGLVSVVLLQRSEGGALGIGGGGGGGFLTGRGTANLLTRVTAALAAAFFVTSILLTMIADRQAPAGSMLDKAAEPAPATAPASGAGAPATSAPPTPAPEAPSGGILDKLK